MSHKSNLSTLRITRMLSLLYFFRSLPQHREVYLENFQDKNNRPQGWTFRQIEQSIEDLSDEKLVNLIPFEGRIEIRFAPKMDEDKPC